MFFFSNFRKNVLIFEVSYYILIFNNLNVFKLFIKGNGFTDFLKIEH